MPHKNTVIAILIFIILAIGTTIAIPLIIDSQKSATLNLFIVPTDAKTTIDGKEFKNGNYRFNPGTVNISIEKDGFESKSLSVNLEPNKTTLVYTPLFCTDSSLTCYLDDEENLEILPYIASYSDRTQEILDFTRKALIKNILPISYSSYTVEDSHDFIIDYAGFDNEAKKIILKISDFIGNGKPLSEQLIKESGFDPVNYKITYERVFVGIGPENDDNN